MAVYVGKEGKVDYNGSTISEMGSWSLTGISVEQLDATAFGDEWKEFALGVGDYGTVSFKGNWDMSDTYGQKLLHSALENKSKLVQLKLYVDNTSYYTPNTNVTSSGGTAGAGVLLTGVEINFDRSGIGTISFTGKCTGPMILM